LFAIFIGCGPSDSNGNGGPGSSTTTDGIPKEPGEPSTEETIPLSTFTTGQYMLSTLAVYDETDTDGDGEVDNNLPVVIELLELTVGTEEFSIDAINTALVEGLYPANIVLLDAINEDNVLTVDLLQGDESVDNVIFVDPSSYDTQGDALNSLVGSFLDQFRFSVEAETMDLPLTLSPDTGAISVVLHDVRFSGTMDGLSQEGVIRGVIPVDQLVNDVAEPLIPEEGVAIGSLWMTKDEVMDLIADLAPLIGDVDLGDAGMGVSAALNYTATPESF
jgi:hypothetical protein